MSLTDFVASNYSALICAALCGILLYEIRKLTKKHSVPAWMRNLNSSITRAANDPKYLDSELAHTQNELAKSPAPSPIPEITPFQEYQLRSFPSLAFLFALFGIATLLVGVIHSDQPLRWTTPAGWVCLLIALSLYMSVEALIPRYSRVQLLNKKYLLQKVGKIPARFETLKELVEYYPKLGHLRIELADQLASNGNTTQALETLRQAAENEPENIDISIAAASMHLRENNPKEAEKMLEKAETQRRQPLDPRLLLYHGAISLKNGDKTKAKDLMDQALTKNENVSRILVEKDPALTGMNEFVPKKKAE